MDNSNISIEDELNFIDYLTIFKLIDGYTLHCIKRDHCYKGVFRECDCNDGGVKRCPQDIIRNLSKLTDYKITGVCKDRWRVYSSYKDRIGDSNKSELSTNILEFIDIFLPKLTTAIKQNVSRFDFLSQLPGYDTANMYYDSPYYVRDKSLGDLCFLPESQKNASLDILKNTVNVHRTVNILGNIKTTDKSSEEVLGEISRYNAEFENKYDFYSYEDRIYKHSHSYCSKTDLCLMFKSEFDYANTKEILEQETLLSHINNANKSLYDFERITITNHMHLHTLSISRLPYLTSLTIRSCGVFSAYLSGYTNDNSEANCVKLLKYLEIVDSPVNNAINIRHLVNLETIKLNSCGLTKLILPNSDKLSIVDLGNNKIESIDVSSCSELTELHLYQNRLTELDITSETIKTINLCGNKKLTSIKIQSDSLEKLYMNNCPAATINYDTCKNIRELKISKNNLTKFSIGKLKLLRVLDVSGNKLKSIDVSAYPCLEKLNICHNDINVFQYDKTNKITDININWTNLTTGINLDHFRKLQILYASNFRIRKVTFSNKILMIEPVCESCNQDKSGHCYNSEYCVNRQIFNNSNLIAIYT